MRPHKLRTITLKVDRKSSLWVSLEEHIHEDLDLVSLKLLGRRLSSKCRTQPRPKIGLRRRLSAIFPHVRRKLLRVLYPSSRNLESRQSPRRMLAIYSLIVRYSSAVLAAPFPQEMRISARGPCWWNSNEMMMKSFETWLEHSPNQHSCYCSSSTDTKPTT